MSLPYNAPILIVGAGTFGVSTALSLLRRGYTSVTILDAHPFPSPTSAASDINKIIHTSQPDPLHFHLANEALAAWRADPVFSPFFHEVGILLCANSEEPLEYIKEGNRQREKEGKETLKYVEGAEQFREIIPALEGPLAGWKGYIQPTECGWAHAKNALISAGNEAAKLGAKFIVGRVIDLLHASDGKTVTGVKTEQGEKYYAKKVVISAGASSIDTLDFRGQLLAKCWTLAHIKLTPSECTRLKDIPVLLNLEHGFFFEPDETGALKICNEFPGYTNFREDGISEPIARDEIPLEAEKAIRELFRATIPAFADRKFVFGRICWCTDTPDRKFLIGEHPEHPGLVLATGDSGHGFKYFPTIGKYIGSVVEKGDVGLSEEYRKAWRWRPETVDGRDNKQKRWGGTGEVSDLKDIDGWTNIGSGASSKL